MHKFLFCNKFIIFLYMFRALLFSSSGGQNCIIQHLASSHLVGGRPVHRLREDSLTLGRTPLYERSARLRGRYIYNTHTLTRQDTSVRAISSSQRQLYIYIKHTLTRQDSSVRAIRSSQKPLHIQHTHNTQQIKETNFHAFSGNRTRDPSNLAATVLLMPDALLYRINDDSSLRVVMPIRLLNNHGCFGGIYTSICRAKQSMNRSLSSYNKSTVLVQCFSIFVRPRTGKFFSQKTRVRSQQIYS